MHKKVWLLPLSFCLYWGHSFYEILIFPKLPSIALEEVGAKVILRNLLVW